MTLCVYALVSPVPARIGQIGIAGERLRAVTVSGIGAIVGEMRRPPAATEKNLKRYASVLRLLAEESTSILPARFGTCVIDGAELTVVVRARAAGLRSRLRAVRGRVQMTIRLFESERRDTTYATPSPTASRSQPGLARGESRGTHYLKVRAEAAAMRDVKAVAPLRDAVRRFVRDERKARAAGVVTINHLIPKGAIPAYRAAVERAAAREGVRLIVTGPWPPYAFADN